MSRSGSSRLPGPISRNLRVRVRRLLGELERLYPDARCTLDHENPFQLLVATILSAQCTDERVNALTPSLFRRYPDAAAFAGTTLPALERAVKPTGFYRNKARSIREASRRLVEEHAGEVPRDMESLTALPGVGRKTANVLRAACFGEQAIIVDTHVKRVSRRLQLTGEEDPVKIELDLMELFEEDRWSFASHGLILHGRRVCHARRPDCGSCVLAADCPSKGKGAA